MLTCFMFILAEYTGSVKIKDSIIFVYKRCSAEHMWRQEKQSMRDGQGTKWFLCGALLCWRH